MMRQILLVPVDSDQILQRARQPRLLVRFQLREVENHICLDDISRHEVLVAAGPVRHHQLGGIVLGHAEGPPIVGHRLEQAFGSEIE